MGVKSEENQIEIMRGYSANQKRDIRLTADQELENDTSVDVRQNVKKHTENNKHQTINVDKTSVKPANQIEIQGIRFRRDETSGALIMQRHCLEKKSEDIKSLNKHSYKTDIKQPNIGKCTCFINALSDDNEKNADKRKWLEEKTVKDTSQMQYGNNTSVNPTAQKTNDRNKHEYKMESQLQFFQDIGRKRELIR